MISYYSAVFVTALLLLGLLQFAVRKGSSNQKKLVLKVVGLTSGIAFLLPTMLNTFTLLQTGLLMAALAALAGAFVPVAELLPVKNTASDNEGVNVKKRVAPEIEMPVALKENHAEETVFEDETETPEELSMEETFEPDETVSEETIEETIIEETVCEEVADVEDVIEEVAFEEMADEEVVSEEIVSEEMVNEEVSGGIVLPDTFSETMAEIMLMNGYLALQEDEEDEAIESFMMVCRRAQMTDQRMMAYMELKLLLPETGRMIELIHLCDELLEGNVELTTLQAGYIEKHTHYLKRLVSLLNAHGASLDQPYSAMPDELKEMAMTYQK